MHATASHSSGGEQHCYCSLDEADRVPLVEVVYAAVLSRMKRSIWEVYSEYAVFCLGTARCEVPMWPLATGTVSAVLMALESMHTPKGSRTGLEVAEVYVR